MRLREFRVTNYRNVLDSGWIEVSDITAFVGQNEAGKSNNFEALYRINPFVANEAYNIDEDWPVDDWGNKDPSAVVCQAKFTLTRDEIESLYGEAALPRPEKQEGETAENAGAEDDIAARPSHHDGEDDHEHDDFASVVVELPEVTDIDALVAAIGRLAREQNVLRAKGYLAVAGKPMRLLVQSVGERVRHQFDRPWGAAPRQSKLVVIGEQGDIDEAAIKAGLGV